MSAQLETEQDDIGARLQADSYFADIKVLVQRKGVTENDIVAGLSTLNEEGGKIGAIAIVIMPSLTAPQGSASGPEYAVRHAVQVIEEPLLSQGAGGVGKSAEAIAQKVRQLLHYFAAGGSALAFDGMEPIAADEGKISYGVYFRRAGRDDGYQRCGLPLISPDEGAAPQTVTLTTATADASIYYTTDGSYPSSANDEATLYTAPFSVATACTLRCAAQKTGLQQSNISEATFS